VSSVGAAITSGAPQNGTVTWTIPLQVSVSIGGSAQPPAVTGTTVDTHVTGGVGAATEEEVITIDQNFKARKGYDPDFLGVKVELPRLSAVMQKETLEVPSEFRRNGQKHVLHYHNFSLALNKTRRMAWFSACVVDGDRRPKITRGKDKWFFDPRIDRKFQAGEEVYVDKAIDRGHITRREDAAWGDTLKAAINANNDTFHFTNASPQLSAFNQGQDRWQGLENFLLDKAKKEKRRLVVITGPVFAKSDPLYRNAQMNFSLRVPLQFWKVCVLVREDDTVSATAFLLGQEEIAELPGFGEKFNAAVAQITIKDLEHRTGLTFGSLSQHDHLGEGGKPGTLEIMRESRSFRIQPIEDYDDIVL
jgi:endonuclease G